MHYIGQVSRGLTGPPRESTLIRWPRSVVAERTRMKCQSFRSPREVTLLIVGGYALAESHVETGSRRKPSASNLCTYTTWARACLL